LPPARGLAQAPHRQVLRHRPALERLTDEEIDEIYRKREEQARKREARQRERAESTDQQADEPGTSEQ